MKALKLTIILSCLISAFTCSPAKYQIKVLNTPTITIDNREAKVGDWFNDQSIIVWSRDNQAMRVVSDENKVYTLSAKLYKEAKAKKFSDFILNTKPLAVRGTKDLDLIEQLAERFDNMFIMLDEIVIDLSDIDLPSSCKFLFRSSDHKNSFVVTPTNGRLHISRKSLNHNGRSRSHNCNFAVTMQFESKISKLITETFEIESLPLK